MLFQHPAWEFQILFVEEFRMKSRLALLLCALMLFTPFMATPASASVTLEYTASSGATLSVDTVVVNGRTNYEVTFSATTGEILTAQVEETDAETTTVRLADTTIVYHRSTRSGGTVTFYEGGSYAGTTTSLALGPSALENLFHSGQPNAFSGIADTSASFAFSSQFGDELMAATAELASNPTEALNWGCVWAIVSLVASYAFLAPCAAGILPACLVAIAMHQVAVASFFTSCFP